MMKWPLFFIPIVSVWHINLFIAAVLSASIVPLPSEPAILYTLKALTTERASGDPINLIFVPIEVFIIAVIGGMIGSVSNYYIGWKGIHNWIVKRDKKDEKKAEKLINKYGFSVLLLAPWIPFIGDPLLIAAGAFEMNFYRFFVWVLVGRMIKVAAVIYLGVEYFKLSTISIALFGVG